MKRTAQSAEPVVNSGSAKNPLKKTVKKKKRSKKLVFQNKVLAAGIAGALIVAALVSSLLVVFLYEKKDYSPGVTQAPPVLIEPLLNTESTPEAAAVPPHKPAAQVRPAEEPMDVPARREILAQEEPFVRATPPAPVTPTQTPKPPSQAPVSLYPAGLAERVPEKSSGGTLVFVIDDAGNNLQDLEPFLGFPGPLTIAVLPGLPHSAETARRIRAAGKGVFLHQPMESLGGHNPGPGAVFTGMEEDEIRSIINRNLDEVWPVSGINNHEGSRVSMDEKIMEVVLTICEERGILYLDSRTTAETVVPAIARRMGIKTTERDVFLDNEKDRDSMMGYINRGLERAGQKGSAVMIGHTSTPGLAALLGEHYSAWISQNYTLTTASAFIGKTP